MISNPLAVNELTVVMYHYVRDIKCSRYPEIKGLETDDFICQLEFLNRNYNIVSMEQVVAAVEKCVKLPYKALLLTFDDGYIDHFITVYPILKNLQLHGSFFVPGKAVMEHKVLDVNKVHFTLASCRNILQLKESLRDQIEKYKNDFRLHSYDEYYTRHAIANRFDNCDVIFIKRMLQHVLPEALRLIITDHLFEQFVGIEQEIFSRELYMNSSQLAQLVQEGMHVGCHGYDHYWWGELDYSALDQELYISKRFLESIGCDMNSWTASYPYGSFNDKVVTALKSHGCKLAFTTQIGITELTRNNAYMVARLDTNDFPPKSELFKEYKYSITSS